MYMPPHLATWLVLKAQLADGSTQMLIESGRELPSNWIEYIWPSVGAREWKFREETMTRTNAMAHRNMDALCDYERKCWDAKHDSAQHIRSIEAYYSYEEIAPIDFAGTLEPNKGENLIYKWVAPREK